MNELLLQLLGVRASETGAIVAASFEVHPVIGWSLFILLGAFAIGVAFLSYRRRDVELTPTRRRVLCALRIIALLGIAAVLLRPGLGLTVEGLIRQSVVLLFDQSASMTLRDPRTDAADLARMGIAQGDLDAEGGLNQRATSFPSARPSRLDLLRAVVTNRELALVERLSSRFDIKAVGFARDLMPLATVEQGNTNHGARVGPTPQLLAASLRADGRETALGTALRDVLARERGHPLGGVVLFTDGIRNFGIDARDAAALARESGIAVHTVGIGTTQPRDLQLVEVTAPEVAFARDEVPVTVRIRARGLTGQTVQLGLNLNNSRVDEQDTLIEQDGESLVSLKFTPEEIGDFELSVESPARPDEILTENNRESRRLRVVDDRIRVLLLEQSPRWEFRYLQALLLRDRRVELKCVLFDGDPAIARGAGSPYLEEFPARREDLFVYDLIVFGDVDPRNFTPSQLEVLSDFVARGGGSFLMLAGRRFSPWAYRDTPIERMLPVEFERLLTETAGTTIYDRPLELDLTPEGEGSSLLRLADDPAENARRWEDLPPLFWVAPVGRAKPAAEVFVTQKSGDSADAPIPVIALQQYGVGRSMFVGTDNTWRWRKNEGESFYVSFWGRIVQRLAIHHLLSGNRRTQVTLDRVEVVPGERVSVAARLFTSAFEPLTEPTVRAWIHAEPTDAEPDHAPTELLLRAVPDQPGLFHGELVASTPGRYRLRVGEDAPVAIDFTVEDRLVEAGETAMQEELLRDLANLTGGNFFREEDLHRLPDLVRSQAQQVQSRLVIELWSSPLYYLLILAFLTAEWALRKWWQLK